MMAVFLVFFFPDRVKWISNFDSSSRKEEGVGKLIIFHLQRIQLRGRNFLIHWFQDNRMSRSMPDVTFSLWRWEEETGCYWSGLATAGKGLRYVTYKELEHRKRFGCDFWWIWWAEDSLTRYKCKSMKKGQKALRPKKKKGLACCRAWFTGAWLPSGIVIWQQALGFFI